MNLPTKAKVDAMRRLTALLLPVPTSFVVRLTHFAETCIRQRPTEPESPRLRFVGVPETTA